ncbi:hypothetical protein P4578_18780, partial [Niallia circulans]|uniref:hypothetical protein n=1 Tax=Niallia circulans TaxID=1397 RepID=UPI002E22330F|nr:hypothetical protein [Niallia circulans]
MSEDLLVKEAIKQAIVNGLDIFLNNNPIEQDEATTNNKKSHGEKDKSKGCKSHGEKDKSKG